MTQSMLPGFEPATEPEPTPSPPSPARPARRKSFDRLVDTLLVEMTPGEVIAQLITLRAHAAYNALLAIVQLPHATMLRTDARWDSEWGRRVRPGQHPIVLLAPFGPVELYFDVSQTEPTERGRRLPVEQESLFTMTDVAHAPQLFARIVHDAKRYGVRVVTSEVGTPLAGRIRQVSNQGSQEHGATAVPVRWVVTVAAAHSPTEQLSTLVHELGHLFCGHVGAGDEDPWSQRPEVDRATAEFEAESVTQIVFGRLAPDTALPAYSDLVLADDSARFRAGWVQIVQAADRVMKPCQQQGQVDRVPSSSIRTV